MALTPLLIATMQGLLDNNSLNINKPFKDQLNVYANQPIVKAYREISGIDNYYYSVSGIPLPVDSINVAIRAIFSTVPFLADIYTGSKCNITSRYMSEYLLNWSYMILGTHYSMSNGNHHARFLQTMQIATGYIDQMNGAINSAVNGNDVGASSFTSSNELVTGNLTAITTNTPVFGDDSLNTGKLLDFSKLKFYGTPHSLVLSLIRTNAITLIEDELKLVGIELSDLIQAVVNSKIALLAPVQKLIYSLATEIIGTKLTDILLVMNVSTEGIETLADLIDTYKIFPASIPYLLTMQNGKLIPLTEGGVSSPLENIIPENIAKYNIAFRNSLYQVKNIMETKPAPLAEQFKSIEKTTGLDAINSFTTSTPPEVKNGILGHLAHGQGDDGLFYLTDAVGTPCGTTHYDTMIEFNKYHNSLNNAEEQAVVDQLELIVAEAWIADAEYRADNDEPDSGSHIPPPPFQEAWDDWNAGRIAYVTQAVQPFLDQLAILVNALPPAPDIVLESWNASLTQVATEVGTLTEALDWVADYGDYPNGGVGGLCGALWNPVTTPAAKKFHIGFTDSVHSISSKTDLHDVVEVLEKLAIANTGGDALVGAMREGRNLKKLDKVGVKTDTKVNPQSKTTQPGEIKPT